MLRVLIIGFYLLFVLIPSSLLGDEVEKRVKKPVKEAITIMQKTQAEEEAWRILQEQLTAEYDALEKQVDQLLKIQNGLEEDVTIASERIKAKEKQLQEIKRIELEVEPFLEDLFGKLTTLPDENLPFLQKERENRISRLKSYLADPENTLSEKYRKSMEVLQIEAEFGFTIESTQEMIDVQGKELLANVFRLGRVGLYYVTLDERQCGYYDLSQKKWQSLPDQYIGSLLTAVAIAEKRRPVEFINMPLGRIVNK